MLIAGSVDLASVLASLATRRPVFHSEADFQLALAREIEAADPDMFVYLETRPAEGVHLDMACESHGRYTAIELKYLTRPWSDIVEGQSFHLKVGAVDYGRYDVVKDIARIEGFVGSRDGSNGAVVVLTNDPSYWRSPGRSTAIDSAFRIHEGAVLEGLREWGRTPAGKKRRAAIKLDHSYEMRWSEFSEFEGQGRLWQLVVEVPGPDATVFG